MQIQIFLRDADGDFVIAGAETRSRGFEVRVETWDTRRVTFTRWGAQGGRTYNLWGKRRPQAVSAH